MAYFYGFQGSVKFDSAGVSASTLLDVTDWSLTVDKEIIDTTTVLDTYSKKVGGVISGSGTVKLIYSASNTSFINSINTSSDPGTAKFELCLSEADNKKITFFGLINRASYGVTREEMQTMSCDFVTNGEITMSI